ncbi:MAG: hypothetical protein R6U44_10815 [Archaeoglobaceae archaeon]
MYSLYVRVREKTTRSYKKIGHIDDNFNTIIDWSLFPSTKQSSRAIYIRVSKNKKRRWLNIGVVNPHTYNIEINWKEVPKSGKKVRLVKEIVSKSTYSRFYRFLIENDGFFVCVGSASMTSKIKSLGKDLPTVKGVEPFGKNPTYNFERGTWLLALIMKMNKKELEKLFHVFTYMRDQKYLGELEGIIKRKNFISAVEHFLEEIKEEYNLYRDMDSKGFTKCPLGYIFYEGRDIFLVTPTARIYSFTRGLKPVSLKSLREQTDKTSDIKRIIYTLKQGEIPKDMEETQYFPQKFMSGLRNANEALAVTVGFLT